MQVIAHVFDRNTDRGPDVVGKRFQEMLYICKGIAILRFIRRRRVIRHIELEISPPANINNTLAHGRFHRSSGKTESFNAFLFSKGLFKSFP